jgi:hypothetical protein
MRVKRLLSVVCVVGIAGCVDATVRIKEDPFVWSRFTVMHQTEGRVTWTGAKRPARPRSDHCRTLVRTKGWWLCEGEYGRIKQIRPDLVMGIDTTKAATPPTP